MNRASSRGLLFLGALIIATVPALEGRIDKRWGHLLLYWLFPLCGVFDTARESPFVQGSTLVGVVVLSVVSAVSLMLGRDLVLGVYSPDPWQSLLLLTPPGLAAVLALTGVWHRDIERAAHWGRLWMAFHLLVSGLVAGWDSHPFTRDMAWALVFGAALVMAGEWLTRRENPPRGEPLSED